MFGSGGKAIWMAPEASEAGLPFVYFTMSGAMSRSFNGRAAAAVAAIARQAACGGGGRGDGGGCGAVIVIAARSKLECSGFAAGVNPQVICRRLRTSAAALR